MCPDVAPKCEIYYSYFATLASLNIPVAEKDMIAIIIRKHGIPLGFKMMCIDKVIEQRDKSEFLEFRKQTLLYLSKCMPIEVPSPAVVSEPPRIPLHPAIPVQESFPVIQKVDHHLQDTVKTILSNPSLSIALKLGQVNDVLTDPQQKEFLRLYLKDMDIEMKFLNNFPETARGEMAAVLREESFSFEIKLHLMKHILPDPGHRKQCKEFLKAQNQAESQKNEGIKFIRSFKEDEESINILVLGETGVGKSTFINALANYFMFANLHEAKAKGPEILISTSFTEYREDIMHTIYCSAPKDGDRNENLTTGESSTRDPKFYRFYGKLLGEDREINLLDTPGIGDVAGIEKDAENFEKIFSCLRDWKNLHAIFILLKSGQCRLTECMTYCLGELFGRLNKNCAPNVIFCCTSARTSEYTPGETLFTLQVLLGQIETKWGREIPCHRQSVFSFDNESFRFLCASKQIDYDENYTDTYNQSWLNAVSEVLRLFTRINSTQLTACKMADTLAVFNVRTTINTLLKSLTEDQKNLKVLEKIIEEKELEFKSTNSKREELLPKQYIDRVESIRRPRQDGRIDMVCIQCGKADLKDANQKHYNICHQNCKCPETSAARLNSSSDIQILKCQCFDQKKLKCKVCECPWQLHMKTDKELVCRDVKILDKGVDEQIKKTDQELLQTRNMLDRKKNEKRELESHLNSLENDLKSLGTHLKVSCLLPYHGYIDDYAKKQIENIKTQGDADRDKKIIVVQNMQAQYYQLIRVIDQIGIEVPMESVDSLISRIKRQPSGSRRDLFKNVVSFDCSSQSHSSTEVDIGRGWMGSLKDNLY